MPDNHDPVTLTLSALRTDVERTPLTDSRSVRRRGDRRTRNQAIGGALAVVALVAGVAGIVGGIDTDRRATEIPATPTPSAEQLLDLAAQPLLTPGDLGTVGPYEGWQVSPDPVTPDTRLSLCVPDPYTLAAAETQTRSLYGDLEATADEHVLRFTHVSDAAAAVRTLTTAFATCDPGDPGEASVVDRAPVAPERPVGDESIRASRTSTPVLASEVSYFELGVVRQANVVVVLQWWAGPLPQVDWVWNAQRLEAALDRAVAPR